jgi:membrane associated rhomboid family serine protease
MFVHAGIINAAAVFVFLKIFGDNVEDKLGGRRLLAIFLLSGLLGALAHVIVHPRSEIPILGADAALAGVIGAYVVMFPRVRIRGFFSARFTVLSYALIWVVAHVVAASIDLLELVPTTVPWFAHLAGFAIGVAFALRYRAQRLRTLAQQRAAAPVGGAPRR